MDKESAVIEWLQGCGVIRDSPLFFNFINAKDDNKQFVTMANEKTTQKPYIDGSVMKQYSFTVFDFKSITYNALVLQGELAANENVSDFLDVQGIIDWVTEQNRLGNFPNFGERLDVESVKALSENPMLNGVDTSVKPVLAKYSVSIQVNYLDRTEVVWGD